MFNFACLMNNAYRDNERPHVHFHFIPRYKNELKLFNKIYKDRHFGYNFWTWTLNRFKQQKDIFTKEDYLLLAKLLSQQKEKVRQEKEDCKIAELQAMYRSVK